MAVAADKFILTQKGYDELQRELAELQGREGEYRDELVDAFNNKLGTDDSPDMAAEFEARTKKEYVDERIGHLQFILERAEVSDGDANPKGVDPGERVTLWDFAEEEEVQFDVLSSAEVTSQVEIGAGVPDVSASSPIGQALLGKEVGDIVEVQVPDGMVKYAVRRIEPIPED